MKQETNTLDGILDIVLPLAPVDSGLGLYSIIAMIVLFSAIVIGMGYHWWKKPRQRCRRELGKLLRQHNDGHITRLFSSWRKSCANTCIANSFPAKPTYQHACKATSHAGARSSMNSMRPVIQVPI
jgi:hypothetical protein